MLSPALTAPTLCTWPAATPLPQPPPLRPRPPGHQSSRRLLQLICALRPVSIPKGSLASMALSLPAHTSYKRAPRRSCVHTHTPSPHTFPTHLHIHQSHTHPSTRTGTSHCTPTHAHDPGSLRPLLDTCAGGTVALEFIFKGCITWPLSC